MVDYETVYGIFEMYFDGEKNMVTPSVYGYDIRRWVDGKIVLFEKSKSGYDDLYGVTTLLFDEGTGEVQRIDLSKCFSNAVGVENYIWNLTIVNFESADLYGVIKKFDGVDTGGDCK